MSTEIKMPQLGESVVEGTISRWLKKPGERVEKYEALLEVMTDKVDTEVPAPEAGVIREIMVPEGQTVRVGTTLAVLEAEGATRNDPRPMADDRQPAVGDQQTVPTNGAKAGVQRASLSTQATNTFMSPIVARLVAEHGLDVNQIRGSGANGRVTKQDVLRYLDNPQPKTASRPPVGAAEITAGPPVASIDEPALQEAALSETDTAAAPNDCALENTLSAQQTPIHTLAPAAPAPLELPEDAEIVPISPMRRAIAEHMVRSRQTSPHVTTVFEVDLSRAVAHREQHKAEYERQGVKLTFTAYFAQAAIHALHKVPMVNASYTEQGIVVHRRVHLGIAVALDEGLIVPIVRDADEKNLLGLARAINDLSSRARARRLKSNETQGGTFTITNHGVSGSLFATPIINQPQAAILGVGAIQKRPVVITQHGSDALAIRPMCYLSLTIDHRLLDGAAADTFLQAMKHFLEEETSS